MDFVKFILEGNYKMIDILERIIDLYFGISKSILWGVCIVFLIAVVYFLYSLKENQRYNISKLLQSLFSTFWFAGIGALLHVLGVTSPIDYVYFNVMFFFVAASLIVVYMAAQMIFYKKIIRPVLRNAVYFQCLIYVELVLLAATNHLEILEWAVGMAVIVLIQLMPKMLEPLERKKQGGREEQEETGHPNPNLYYTRKKQLESFIPILKQQRNEPYAILISGAWGMGKSSFVKALEKRMEGDYFRWIYAGSEASVSSVMGDISKKILEVLQENNVYIERGNLIEEYFEAFSGVLEKHIGLKFVDKIAGLCGINRNVDSKEYLNKKLGELEGTVYLIIDDLDRCDAEYQDKMFKVIRESTMELTKCKTIFLADKEKFCVDRAGEGHKQCREKHYIEKYISYTLDLCRENYDEILDYYIGIIISDEFLRGMNQIYLKDRSVEEIRNMIYQCPEEILRRYSGEYTKREKQKPQKNGDEEQYKELKRQHDKRLSTLKTRMAVIEENVTNSRKVKNFLKGIRWNIENLNTGVELCSLEFQKEDWIKAVIEIQFVKNMLPEVFDDLKKYRDIVDIRMRNKECNVDALFALNESAIGREKKIYVFNEIIYHADVIEFAQMKTEKEEYLGELHGNSLKMEHINGYVKYAESYEDLKKTLQLCEERSFQKEWDREDFLRNILERMGDQYGWSSGGFEEFLELSKMLVEYMKCVGVSEQERRLCKLEGDIIAQRIIAANSWRFRYVLSFLFSVEKVEDAWHMRQPSDIFSLYRIMENIDSRSKYMGLHNDNKLDGIKDYCKSLEEELKKEKYKVTGVDFEKIFVQIELILESCRFWKEIDRNLEPAGEENLPLFKDYFSSNGAVYDDTVFRDVGSLVQALGILKQFYEEKAHDYQAKFSEILAGICYKIILRYEENQEWFAGREAEVMNLLTEQAELVYELDKPQERYELNEFEKEYDTRVLDQIRLYTYKFKEAIGNREAAGLPVD